MEEMRGSPVLIAILAFLVAGLTVFVSPIYRMPGANIGENVVVRGWPVGFLSYTSTANVLPFLGGFLEPFSFSVSWSFDVVGFIINWFLWFSILYFIFSFIGRGKEV